ncbi:MAG: hypothetical protein WCT77_04125 [Bacteroidota bacterium]|jgi:hypothetical protein
MQNTEKTLKILDISHRYSFGLYEFTIEKTSETCKFLLYRNKETTTIDFTEVNPSEIPDIVEVLNIIAVKSKDIHI